jgi:hypothetical protein
MDLFDSGVPGIHYASDIVAGIAIGIATVWIALRSNSLRSMVEEPFLAVLDRRPPLFYAIAFLISFEMATVFEGLRLLGNVAIHALMAALHLGPSHTNLNRPIDVWMGFLAIFMFLVIVGGVIVISHRKSPARHAYSKYPPVEPGALLL